MRIILFTILVLGLTLTSCESNTYEDVTDIDVASNLTYQANVKPIITTNCLNCHSSNIQYPNLETYEEVKEVTQNGNLLCRIDDQSCGSVMPQGGRLPQVQIDIIKLWATNGFINQ